MLKKITDYFYVVRISISLAILCEICIQIGYFFCRSYARKQKWVFFSEHNVHKICTILTANLLYLICNLLQQPAFFDVVYVLQTQKTMQCCCHCTLQSTVRSNWGIDFWMEGPYSIHGTTTMSDACGSANLKNYHYNQCYVYD